ncbi:hypothetical protein B0H16DRAFT_1467437 [Mycena metata]|uniref:Uncharacterized protein n=1 Tax=Mycena metata TaxID=1033252 RepID=A0AAD7I645_9AGAR|nr:hypothetical protein B0H16DRAFT_1467437 [Mycena metata]
MPAPTAAVCAGVNGAYTATVKLCGLLTDGSSCESRTDEEGDDEGGDRRTMECKVKVRSQGWQRSPPPVSRIYPHPASRIGTLGYKVSRPDFSEVFFSACFSQCKGARRGPSRKSVLVVHIGVRWGLVKWWIASRVGSISSDKGQGFRVSFGLASLQTV